MTADTHVNELLPAYAMGCLDDEEATRVSRHLETCTACRAELSSYQTVTHHLALAAPDAIPAAGLRRELIRRVQPARPQLATGSRRSRWEWVVSLWRRAAPAWGLVSLVLILALALSNVMLWRQVNESKTTPAGLRTVSLSGTGAAAGATGTIVISMDGEHGTLVVDGLLPLDEGHQYQLWLIRDGQRTDGGVFSVNPDGYGSLWVSSLAPLSSYPSFGITIEPAGGSPGPTGDKVLGGSL